MCKESTVYIIDRSSKSEPVAFGKQELLKVLTDSGKTVKQLNFWTEACGDSLCLVIGETSARLVEKLLVENDVRVSGGAEGIVMHWCETGGGKVLVVSGTDERGLMYALLELADRVRCRGADMLQQVGNIQEYPQNMVRGVDRFVMGHRDDDWFYSEEFWRYFFKRLARNRFNRFTLITGFDTAYMSPPYPYFVEVPGFPYVTAKNVDRSKREKNLGILRLIGRLCKSYGLDFIFSTWQQLPWTENQQILVENIPSEDDEFKKYCSTGIREILLACPEIAGIQFRVNLEAGIRASGDKSSTHEKFWRNMIDSVASVGRPIKLDLRAKGLTDNMLEYAMNSGLDISVPTKYWCEHAALPYHIPQLRTEEMKSLDNFNSSRRYSYDNLLRKPHWYDMIYRLWNYGSTNLFLWGDPDYCRRFSESCSMGEGVGFQINSPLSLKGGHELIPGEAWPIHISPEIIDYKWEDERYWMYYTTFGRLGYSTNTDEDVWKRELDVRFGKETADHVETAYRWASKIMPLITTAHFPVHPSLHYWPELYSGAALFHKNNYDPYFKEFNYINSLPSDEALFYSIENYVEDMLANDCKCKYSPLQVRDWLKTFADNTRKALKKAAEAAGGTVKGELKAVVVDFSMLADIAEFHAWKIKAAYHLCLFQKKGCKEQLVTSYQSMIVARTFWDSLSRLGNKYYNRNLEFNAGTGTKRNGNWEDRLVKEIDEDIKCLESLLEQNGIDRTEAFNTAQNEYTSMLKPAAFNLTSIQTDIPERCRAGHDLEIKLRADEMFCNGGVDRVYINYRHADHTKRGYIRTEMQKTGDGYRAIIPADYIETTWDLIVFISALDSAGNTLIYPGIYHAQYYAPYFVVKVDGWRDKGI